MEYFTAVNVSRVNTALHSCWTTHSTDSLCWSWHYSRFFSFVSLWVATMSPLPLLLLFYFTTAMPFLFMKVDNDGLFPERPETTTLVTWDPLACHSLSPAHEHAHLLRSHVHRLGFPSNRPALTFQWRVWTTRNSYICEMLVSQNILQHFWWFLFHVVSLRMFS